MNISYLLSVLDLYLKKEKNNKLIIEVDNLEQVVKVEFCYSFDFSNKTFIKIDKKLFFDNIALFMNMIQENLELDKELMKDKKTYTLSFEEKRELTFINFSFDELKLIRENLVQKDINFSFQEEYKILEKGTNETFDKTLLQNKSQKLSFSMGFSNYMTLFLSTILLLDIFMISLWIFKVFIK